MPEVLKKIISSAFEACEENEENNGLNVLKISAQCHKDNTRSERVMIKCGMYKSVNQPEPKLYNGVLKENVRYELVANQI